MAAPDSTRTLSRMTNDLDLDLDADPYETFESWYAHALDTDPQADAMSLATATTSGIPSCRVVLLKGVMDGGFRFFTNYDSRKASDLAVNPEAALLFLWHSPKRQVRIEGNVERLSEADSQAYFASRDRDSQLGAWVSDQSTIVTSRDVLRDVRYLSELGLYRISQTEQLERDCGAVQDSAVGL